MVKVAVLGLQPAGNQYNKKFDLQQNILFGKWKSNPLNQLHIDRYAYLGLM